METIILLASACLATLALLAIANKRAQPAPVRIKVKSEEPRRR